MADGPDQPARIVDIVSTVPQPTTEAHDFLADYRFGGKSSEDGGNPKTGSDSEEAQFKQLVQQAEISEANSTISRIPGTVRKAAYGGDDAAQIMQVGMASFGDKQPPQLDAAQQKVFDELKVQGLNPSIENESYSQEHGEIGEQAWVIKANWKDGQNARPDLQTLAHAGQKRIKAEDEQFLQQAHQREMQDADGLIGKIPALVGSAATSGDDAAQIMQVGMASFGDKQPPQLDAAQQKVFDELKVQGLNPSIENGSYSQEHGEIGEQAWVIKANWKDGQNARPDLQTLAHAGQKRIKAEDEQFLQQAHQREMQDADGLIGKIPALVGSAATSGDDAAQIMQVGMASFGDKQPPQLDAAQQKVFDELKVQGLNPSIENESYSQEHGEIGEQAWVIKANWKDGQNARPDLQTLANAGQKRIKAEDERFLQQENGGSR